MKKTLMLSLVSMTFFYSGIAFSEEAYVMDGDWDNKTMSENTDLPDVMDGAVLPEEGLTMDYDSMGPESRVMPDNPDFPYVMDEAAFPQDGTMDYGDDSMGPEILPQDGDTDTIDYGDVSLD